MSRLNCHVYNYRGQQNIEYRNQGVGTTLKCQEREAMVSV